MCHKDNHRRASSHLSDTLMSPQPVNRKLVEHWHTACCGTERDVRGGMWKCLCWSTCNHHVGVLFGRFWLNNKYADNDDDYGFDYGDDAAAAADNDNDHDDYDNVDDNEEMNTSTVMFILFLDLRFLTCVYTREYFTCVNVLCVFQTACRQSRACPVQTGSAATVPSVETKPQGNTMEPPAVTAVKASSDAPYARAMYTPAGT